jgi:hypothetical protein
MASISSPDLNAVDVGGDVLETNLAPHGGYLNAREVTRGDM